MPPKAYGPRRDPFQLSTVQALTNNLNTSLATTARLPYELTPFEKEITEQTEATVSRLEARENDTEQNIQDTRQLEQYRAFTNYVKVLKRQHVEAVQSARNDEIARKKSEVAARDKTITAIQQDLSGCVGDIRSLQHALEVAAARNNVVLDTNKSLLEQFNTFSSNVSTKKGSDMQASERELHEYKRGIEEDLKESCTILNLPYDNTVTARTMINRITKTVADEFARFNVAQETLGVFHQGLRAITIEPSFSPYLSDFEGSLSSPRSMPAIVKAIHAGCEAHVKRQIYDQVFQVASAFRSQHNSLSLEINQGTVPLVQTLANGAASAIADARNALVDLNQSLKESAARHNVSIADRHVHSESYALIYTQKMEQLLVNTQREMSENGDGKLAAEQTVKRLLDAVEASKGSLKDIGFSDVEHNMSDQEKAVQMLQSYIEGVTTQLDSSKQIFEHIDVTLKRAEVEAQDDAPPVDANTMLTALPGRVETLVELSIRLDNDRKAFDSQFWPAAHKHNIGAEPTESTAVLFSAYNNALEGEIAELEKEKAEVVQHFDGAMQELGHTFTSRESFENKRKSFVDRINNSLQELRKTQRDLQSQIDSTESNVTTISVELAGLIQVQATNPTIEDHFNAVVSKVKHLDNDNKNFEEALRSKVAKHALNISEPTVDNVVEEVIQQRDHLNSKLTQLRDSIGRTLDGLQSAPSASDDLETRITDLFYQVETSHKTEIERLRTLIAQAAKTTKEAVAGYINELDVSPVGLDERPEEFFDISGIGAWLELEVCNLFQASRVWSNNATAAREKCISKLFDGIATIMDTFSVPIPSPLSAEQRIQEEAVSIWVQQCKSLATETTRSSQDQASQSVTNSSQQVEQVIFELREFTRRSFAAVGFREDRWPDIDSSDPTTIRAYTDAMTKLIAKAMDQHNASLRDHYEAQTLRERRAITDRMVASIAMADRDSYYALAEEQRFPQYDDFQKYKSWIDSRLGHFFEMWHQQQIDLDAQQREQQKTERAVDTLLSQMALAFGNMYSSLGLDTNGEEFHTAPEISARPQLVASWLVKQYAPLMKALHGQKQILIDSMSAHHKHRESEKSSAWLILQYLRQLTRRVNMDDSCWSVSVETNKELHLQCAKTLPEIIERVGHLEESLESKEALVQVLLKQSRQIVATALGKPSEELPLIDTKHAAIWFQERAAELDRPKSDEIEALQSRVNMLYEGIINIASCVNKRLHGNDQDDDDIPKLSKDCTAEGLKLWHNLFGDWFFDAAANIVDEQNHHQRQEDETEFLTLTNDLCLNIADKLEPLLAQTLSSNLPLARLNLDNQDDFRVNINRAQRYFTRVAITMRNHFESLRVRTEQVVVVNNRLLKAIKTLEEDNKDYKADVVAMKEVLEMLD